MAAFLVAGVFAESGAVGLFAFQSLVVACEFILWWNTGLAGLLMSFTTWFFFTCWAWVAFWFLWISFITLEFSSMWRFTVSACDTSLVVTCLVTLIALLASIGGEVAFPEFVWVWWYWDIAELVAGAVKRVSLSWLSYDTFLVDWITDPTG
jgi:hypothetical protein